MIQIANELVAERFGIVGPLVRNTDWGLWRHEVFDPPNCTFAEDDAERAAGILRMTTEWKACHWHSMHTVHEYFYIADTVPHPTVHHSWLPTGEHHHAWCPIRILVYTTLISLAQANVILSTHISSQFLILSFEPNWCVVAGPDYCKKSE